MKDILIDISLIDTKFYNVILISSSSSFLKGLRRISYIKKVSSFNEIKNKTRAEINSAIERIFN